MTTTIYTGGSTKDDLDVTGWQHTTGSVPDKDELLDGYAARYGDHLYFGADRLRRTATPRSASGSSAAPSVLSHGGGVLRHPQDGDILVLSDFTKGGGLPTVRVFAVERPGGRHPGPAAINGTLDLLAGTTAQPAGLRGRSRRRSVLRDGNARATPSPWPFEPKTGAAPFPKGHFYEGGIDLEFLDLEDECFSSLILETRSSQSVDAVLKDFVAGGFESAARTSRSARRA